MNSLVRNINEAVEKSITVLFEKICNKYDTVELAELEKIWNDENGSIKVKVQAKPKETINKEKSAKKVDENKSEGGGCPYVFSKGEKAGNICGSKPKNGNEYCSKHKKSAESGGDDKNVKKSESKKSNSISEKSSSTTKKKSPATKKPLERIIKHNKDIDKYWNAETQLVFKSKDDRVVYATFRGDELKGLTDDDILLCEQYGFKFDNNFPVDEADGDEEEKEEVVEKVIKKKDNEKSKKSVEKESINKKILSSAITENNLKAKSIEDVLNELQVDDDDDEFIEEEFEEEEFEE